MAPQVRSVCCRGMVLTKMYTYRRITWVHLWSGDVYTGGEVMSVEAPFGYPAVFYRLDSTQMLDVLDRMREQGLDIHP